MTARQILKLRDHYHFTAQGESWVPAIKLNLQTSKALEEAFLEKKKSKKLIGMLSNIISDIEQLLTAEDLVLNASL